MFAAKAIRQEELPARVILGICPLNLIELSIIRAATRRAGNMYVELKAHHTQLG